MKLRRSAAVAAAALMALVGAIVALPGAPATVHAAVDSGGEYHPLPPVRIFDTRSGSNDVAPLGMKPATPQQPSFNVDILGQGGIPDSGVLAVAVNITVAGPNAAGHLVAFGKGSAQATESSIVNFAAGQTVPNSAIVVPGADGELTVSLFSTSSSGAAHVIIDVFGWFSTSSADRPGARLIPINPARFADTREAGGRIGPNTSLPIQIGGVPGIPAGITGAVINITAIMPSAPTHLSALPTPPATPPQTSNVNVGPGMIKANSTFVPVGADGKIYIYNLAGSVDVAVDVTGYLQNGFDPSTETGRVVPLQAPFRAFDTRLGQFGNVALGPGQMEKWSFADFTGSVSIGSSSGFDQLGALGNLTVASIARQYPTVAIPQSHMTVYPGDVDQLPTISNLNAPEGVATPNMALIRYAAADKTIQVYNNLGYAHYLFDVSAVILG